MDEDVDLMLLEWEDDSALQLVNLDDVPSSFQPYPGGQNINQISTKEETLLQQIDEDLDYAFALSLQTQYEEEVKENVNSDSKKSHKENSQSSKPLSIVDKQWELLDPHPDIHALFQEFDNRFFYGKLKHVEVKWSPRMTLCAGVCSYEGRGGLCSVRLSVPLLKLRPRKDLVETLLHEMIHAYLFVTHNNKDRDGHGPQFLSHMHRINKESGTRITVYHSFHDEVDLYRQHWWKCDGPCRKKHPFYGVLKRAMNRPPGPKDNWWAEHQATCGGTFVKIKEPDDYGKKKPTKRKATSENKKSTSNIRSFLTSGVSENKSKSTSTPSATKSKMPHLDSPLVSGNNIATLNTQNASPKKLFIPFQGTGHKLGGSDGFSKVPSYIKGNGHNKTITSSNSSKKSCDITSFSGIHKVPKLAESLYEDQKPSTSISASGVTRNLIQSPIEKFLTSKNTTYDSSAVKKEKIVNQFNVQESDRKVSCPVCSILIKEQDINSHLDTCLAS